MSDITLSRLTPDADAMTGVLAPEERRRISVRLGAGLTGIGLLGLAVVRPSEYVHLLGTHIGTSASLLEQEQRIFGIDHCELGGSKRCPSPV